MRVLQGDGSRRTGGGVVSAPTTLERAFKEMELEFRQNELYLAMRVVEEMPASEAQTAAIAKLGERMRMLVEKRGKSEVGQKLADG